MPPPRRRACPPFLRALACAAGAAVTWIAPAQAQEGTKQLAEGLTATPLARPTSAHATSMFVEVAPTETGIVAENRYEDPTMWQERFAEFEAGSLGTGVAIGDYDGDGRPDVFVVSKTESCRLFRNLGSWKFEDVTEKAGVGDLGEAAAIWKSGATFVDVNNDGRLDLYVCRFGAPNLLYVNQGDGTFREEAAARGLAVNDASVMAAFCDYDRDGWLDVFVQTNQPESSGRRFAQKNYLFHNNGDGTFTDVTERAGTAVKGQGHAAIWWDFDQDGWPDLYVGNDFTPGDKLFRNQRDGTFREVIDQVVPHMPFSSMGADLGDLNNDGKIDLFVADMAATTHEKDQRTVANARRMILDTPDRGAAPFVMHNALYLNAGNGRVWEVAFLAGLAATDWTWAVRMEDLDNDGRLDLFFTNGMYREPHNADLMERMAKAESIEEKIRLLRASPVLNERHLAYRNLGDLRFADTSAAWGLDQKGVSFGAAFGDLDGDGDLDLIYANFRRGPTVLRNDCETGHRVIVELRGQRSNRFGVGATVTLTTVHGQQVRTLTLERGYLSSSEPSLHFGLGEEDRVQRFEVSWPSGYIQRFANLPADQRFVVTEPANAPANREDKPKPQPQFADVSDRITSAAPALNRGLGEPDLQRLDPFRRGANGPSLAVGALQPGEPEALVIGGTAEEGVRLLHRGSNGRYEPVDAGAAGGAREANCGPVLLIDVDGDGANDLLVTKGGVALPARAAGYQPELYLNDGYGRFRAAPSGALPTFPVSVGAACAADFDRDGRLDLFMGGRVVPGQYPATPQSALWVNRGGRFEDATAQLAPALRNVGLVTSALWSDVDGDGWLDLLVAVEWGEVKCFHNREGKGFDDWTEKLGFSSGGTGWWTAIAAADFNGDGRIDYAVGNVGLNTPYQADEQHPTLLYVGDFKRDDTTQLVEAYYEGDKVYPRRTRKDLGAAIPSILKRFPRNDAYARATLTEILGEEKIKTAQRYATTELRSGVFLSQPDGTYRFTPLPRLAQAAPIQGLVAGDFDGDGFADLYAAQNMYSPIPYVGRFDSGLSQLLLGDGRGNFRAVLPDESGLVLPGDAKALAVCDLDSDGWPDFVATRNGERVVAFRNAVRNKTQYMLRVTATGKPIAVGARVTLEFADGAKNVCEVYAGGGFMSQSDGACYFAWNEKNPPRRVSVRWPSGRVSDQEISRTSAEVQIHEQQ